jgi:hypothetical protein
MAGPKRDPEFDKALESSLASPPPPEPEPAPKEDASAWALIGRGLAALWSRLAGLLAAAWRAFRRSDWPRHTLAALRRWAAAALAWVARHLGGLADRMTPEPAAPQTQPPTTGVEAPG